MWCSNRCGAVAVAALLLAGCGFAPLYGPGTPASGIAGRVEVSTLDGAPGFAMRTRLVERLGAASSPTHRLDVVFELTERGVAVTQEAVTTRFDVLGVAAFELLPLAGGPPVLSGEVDAVTGYSAPASVTASAFASLAAARDAEERLAVLLADRIVQEIALSAGDWAGAGPEDAAQ